MKKLLLIFMLISLIAVTVACITVTDPASTDLTEPMTGSDAQSAPTQEPIVNIPPSPEASYSAHVLSALFEDSPSVAKDLIGKTVEVVGTYKGMTFQDITIDRQSVYGFFMCSRATADSADISMLNEGDVIKVVGTIKNEFGNINMTDCWFIGVASPSEVADALDVSTAAQFALEKAFQSVESVKTDSNGGVVCVVVGKNNVNGDAIRDGMLFGIVDLMEALKNYEYGTLSVEVKYPLVDKYGTETIERVLLVEFSKETREKITLKNFLIANIPDVADTYWVHMLIAEKMR